jgi:hypothetical protein
LIFKAVQTWQWFDQPLEVVVGLETAVAFGLLQLPKLQRLGQAMVLLAEQVRVFALLGLAAQCSAYEHELWGPCQHV